jgi:hypothetical protein
VDEQVEDRLPGGLADVHAEVVAVGLVDALDGGPRVGDGGHQLRAFLVGGREPRGHVTARDDQRVAGRDGELVPQAEDQAPAVEDLILCGAAEGTGRVGHGRRGSVAGVMSRWPESPAATHGAQRHCRTGRPAVQ